MVVLQFCHPTSSLNIQSKLTSSYNHKFPLKVLSKFPSTSFITNSHQPDYSVSLSPPTNQSVAAIVFGDASHESRLYPLTKRRSEGAIPIAGNYRLIDGVISNCINSNITKIYALTQNNSTSLNSHLSRAYSGARLANEGFVEMIAAYQSPDDKGWFQGTADAVRRCLWVLEEYPVVEFLVLPGHHLYKMDYQKLIEAHRNNNADVTVAVSSSMRNHDPYTYDTVRVDKENQVVEFTGSQGNTPIESKVKKPIMLNDNGYDNFPSMGIFVINRVIMIKLLRQYFPKANHLTSDVIPGAISLGMKVQAFKFDGYWEDMRSIEAFYHANMESTKTTNMAYNFYDRDSPLYTLPRYLPPTIVTDAAITNCVIGDGCILSKCSIRNSILGLRTRVGDGAIIEDSVIMGSDIYQSNSDDGKDTAVTIPLGIGEGSHIRKAIVDKNSRIGKNVMIVNKDNVQEGGNEANGYIITGGIVVILKGAVIADENVL